MKKLIKIATITLLAIGTLSNCTKEEQPIPQNTEDVCAKGRYTGSTDRGRITEEQRLSVIAPNTPSSEDLHEYGIMWYLSDCYKGDNPGAYNKGVYIKGYTHDLRDKAIEAGIFAPTVILQYVTEDQLLELAEFAESL